MSKESLLNSEKLLFLPQPKKSSFYSQNAIHSWFIQNPNPLRLLNWRNFIPLPFSMNIFCVCIIIPSSLSSCLILFSHFDSDHNKNIIFKFEFVVVFLLYFRIITLFIIKYPSMVSRHDSAACHKRVKFFERILKLIPLTKYKLILFKTTWKSLWRLNK